jgi:hypothetical protein
MMDGGGSQTFDDGDDNDDIGDDVDMLSLRERYALESRWSTLHGWTAAERVSHFLDALALMPDHLHVIDRLVRVCAYVCVCVCMRT